MSYDNNLSGALFKNDKKERDQDPIYKGSCEIEGEEYWINAWLNEDKNGNKYMKLKFNLKEQKRNPPSREPKRQTRDQQRESDPF